MANTNQPRGGSGNFAHDRERASEAGRKGGEHSHDSAHLNPTKQGAERSSPANFADNPEKAAKAGRKGGQHHH